MITWTISAKCKGYFVVGRQEHAVLAEKPHPALSGLAVEPVLDEQRHETGEFWLRVDFETDEDTTESLVADLARDLFDGVLAMIAFSTGYPCFAMSRPSAKRPEAEEGTYRQLFFTVPLPLGPFGAGQVGRPPVLDETILGRELSDKQQLLLVWWRKALVATDYVDSCSALLAALEPIAMHFPCTDKRIETCPECGHEHEMAAGTGQRVRSFLVDHGGLSEEKARKIWELRNAMSHGQIGRSAAERRAIAELRYSLMSAISRGLREIFGTDIGGMPEAPEGGIQFSDAFLAVSFTEPDSAPSDQA